MLRKFFILNNEIVKIVSKIVGAVCSAMAIKHTEKTNLRPLHIGWNLFVSRLQNVKNYWDTILVILSYYTLICVRRIWFYVTTFLLACFCWFVVSKKYCLWVQEWSVAKKKSLYINKLNIWINLFCFNTRRLIVARRCSVFLIWVSLVCCCSRYRMYWARITGILVRCVTSYRIINWL